MVERGIGPKSLMERSNGCRELGCCLAVCYVMCCVWNRSVSLVGCPAFPFIDQGGAGVTDGRKKKKQRPRRSFEGAGSSFSSESAPLTWQTVSGIGTFARHLCADDTKPLPDQQVVTSSLAPPGGVLDKGVDL